MMNQLSHRKSAARLRLINPDGTPASGQHVKADQISHKFLFGCGAFDSVEMMRTQDGEKKAFLQERMEKWLQLFNYGTLPFYWGRYEPEEGKTAYPETIAAAKWLRENGVQYMILGQHSVGNGIGEPYCGHAFTEPALLERYVSQCE